MRRVRTRHGLKAIQHALKQIEPGRLAAMLPELAEWRDRLMADLVDDDLGGEA